jgi:uncharacterized protein YjbI with pentapeptide repeats
VRLPPLSNDPFRCEKAFVGNTIGQANGVANTLLDLRFCDFSNDTKNLKGKSLTAALMADAKFDGADLTEVVMSKAYAMNASFKGRHITVQPMNLIYNSSFFSFQLSYAEFSCC